MTTDGRHRKVFILSCDASPDLRQRQDSAPSSRVRRGKTPAENYQFAAWRPGRIPPPTDRRRCRLRAAAQTFLPPRLADLAARDCPHTRTSTVGSSLRGKACPP